MRRWLALVAAGLFAIMASAQAGAAEPLVVGKTYNTMLDLRGKQVPLPAGDWVLAGTGYEAVPELNDLAYGAIESAVLFRIDGAAVSAFVIAHRNVIPIEDGWGSASECTRADIPLSQTYDAEEGHTFCGFVAAVDTARTDRPAPAWTAALAFAGERGLALPTQWQMAGFRLSDRNDVIDIRYQFDPASRHAKPRPSPVAGAGATAASAATDPPSNDPPDAAFGLEPFLSAMQGAVKVGFVNGLTGLPPVAMPWSGEAPVSPFVDLRLQQLEQLHAAKLIDADDFQARREAIAKAEVTLAPDQMSNEALTAWKLLTDQVSSAALYLTANYIVLTNVPQSLGLLALQMGADAVQYTVHEYTWNTFGPSRLREAPDVDFAQAGVIVPSR